MEPSARFERASFSLPRRRSIRWSYEGVSWVPRARTWKRRRVKARSGLPGLPIPHHSSRALGRNRTGFLPVTSRPLCQVSYVQRRGVPGAIRTRTTDLLGIVTPAIGLRGHGASGRSRTACLPRTKRTLFPGELQRRELGNQGSNLDSLASEASVLPGYTIPH